MKRLLLLAAVLALGCTPLAAASPMEDTAAAVNRLGLQLLARLGPARENAVLSPYSIQAAFALAYAGADGATRDEMRQVLGYPESDADLALGLPALQRRLEGLVTNSVERVAEQRKYGVSQEPLTLTIANRLFGQGGYPFRPAFLSLTREAFGAPFETLDFRRFPDRARRHINDWVADRTRQRIRDLIPANGVDRETRLVLVNALHFKSGWAEPFSARETQPRPFHARGGEPVEVATLHRRGTYRFVQQAGHAAVFLPFATPELECVILRPDARDGLGPVEAGLPADTWRELGAAAVPRDLLLELPRFKLEPPTVRLGAALRQLGLRRPFNEPVGAADFGRMAPRRPDDYLYLSEAFHQAFVAVDEEGAEAAAATAVAMVRATALPVQRPPPLEFKVDRPFLFAIQHRPTGTCLFLGRVTDPR